MSNQEIDQIRSIIRINEYSSDDKKVYEYEGKCTFIETLSKHQFDVLNNQLCTTFDAFESGMYFIYTAEYLKIDTDAGKAFDYIIDQLTNNSSIKLYDAHKNKKTLMSVDMFLGFVKANEHLIKEKLENISRITRFSIIDTSLSYDDGVYDDSTDENLLFTLTFVRKLPETNVNVCDKLVFLQVVGEPIIVIHSDRCKNVEGMRQDIKRDLEYRIYKNEHGDVLNLARAGYFSEVISHMFENVHNAHDVYNVFYNYLDSQLVSTKIEQVYSNNSIVIKINTFLEHLENNKLDILFCLKGVTSIQTCVVRNSEYGEYGGYDCSTVDLIIECSFYAVKKNGVHMYQIIIDPYIKKTEISCID